MSEEATVRTEVAASCDVLIGRFPLFSNAGGLGPQINMEKGGSGSLIRLFRVYPWLISSQREAEKLPRLGPVGSTG